MTLRKTFTALAVATIAAVAAFGPGEAEAKPFKGKFHGGYHHAKYHGGWGWGPGWHPYPIYAGGYYGCTWVKRVRFVPGHGPVVRWRPACY
jgi:hypothetical protein